MAKARKKTAKKTTHRKARKKTAKRTVKKAVRRKVAKKAGRKRRTPAQVAATKRLVAYNKKHHGKTSKRKTSKRRKSAPVYSHPLSPAQYNLAAREAMASGLAGHLHVGRKRKGRKQVHQIVSVGGRHVGHFENFGPAATPKRRKKSVVRRAPAKKTHRRVETVTAEQILKKAAVGAKQHKIKMWLCAGPRRTGCGGGKRGGHVRGIIS